LSSSSPNLLFLLDLQLIFSCTHSSSYLYFSYSFSSSFSTLLLFPIFSFISYSYSFSQSCYPNLSYFPSNSSFFGNKCSFCLSFALYFYFFLRQSFYSSRPTLHFPYFFFLLSSFFFLFSVVTWIITHSCSEMIRSCGIHLQRSNNSCKYFVTQRTLYQMTMFRHYGIIFRNQNVLNASVTSCQYMGLHT
jgi:hypothetical protein